MVGKMLFRKLLIYMPRAISLIEVINMDDNEYVFNEDFVFQEYQYINSTGFSETYILGFVQNNTGMIDLDQYEVLNRAWDWLRTYFEWEDSNIEGQIRSVNN